MRRRSLLWQIYPTYVLIVLLSLCAVTWYATRAVRAFYLDRMRVGLTARARLIHDRVLALLERGDYAGVDRIAKRLGQKARTRITVILPDGLVVADTQRDPRTMDNHADRPEVRDALRGRVGSSIRFSYTLRKTMLYVAAPLRRAGRVMAVLRVSVPATDIERALSSIRRNVLLVGLAAAVLAGLLSWGVARHITRPLREIEQGAQRFARGDFARALPIPRSAEVASLVTVLNQMAEQLSERMRIIAQQRDELEALLAAMLEGVLAVDTEERIIVVNRAAAELLEIDGTAARGRHILEVVRNPELERFVMRALESSDPIEADFTLRDDAERFIHARATALHDAQRRRIGALVVLNDLTKLRQLERVRREFVANVSHEIKTPITSIKGAAETLLDASNADDVRRFAQIIARQADRLNAIVEDLLTLSRVEQGEEHGTIALRPGRLHEVLEAARKDCELQAADRKIEVKVVCPTDLTARINAPLLEQAVVNLLDNAIKHSEPGSVVHVVAEPSQGHVAVRVVDHGCGIAREHLPRLFERFYRVDKARSRKLGGTGLGLAIVKHIAQAHRGRVSVESEPGQGSTFTIHLPA